MVHTLHWHRLLLTKVHLSHGVGQSTHVAHLATHLAAHCVAHLAAHVAHLTSHVAHLTAHHAWLACTTAARWTHHVTWIQI